VIPPAHRAAKRAEARARLGSGPKWHVANGRCYYCGRNLFTAAPLDKAKAAALAHDQLTCGRCVYVHGRLPWRPLTDYWTRDPYALARVNMRRAIHGKPPLSRGRPK
jgi:hypothetical protein